MRCKGELTCVVAVIVLVLFGSKALGATEQVLHSFDGRLRHGSEPHSRLTSDTAGNLYGTTFLGGDYGNGTVYKLTPNSSGGWSQTVLYSFKGGSDGAFPSTGVIFDPRGNLYGTTSEGGTGPCSNGGPVGCGTVFKLTPNARGGWSETTLYSFQSGNDGVLPVADLVFDSAGALYGTTLGGGCTTCYGTVFKLVPDLSGTWTENILHSFSGGTDGADPYAALVFDAGGNLYGTTEFGGASGNGVVFELTPGSQGVWTENVLYAFAGIPDGSVPTAALLFDGDGNLYSITAKGGTYDFGTVFKLKSNGDGTWTESVLYGFGGSFADGYYPVSVIFDEAGNLYGTTGYGGSTNCFNGCGLVFQLMPQSGGQWTKNLLYAFSGTANGATPFAGVMFDQNANLYGTAGTGGSANLGVVFKVSRVHNNNWKGSTIYLFPGGEGAVPTAGLVADQQGNLYGTTSRGGKYENGSVFKLSSNSNGAWTSSTLYSFKGGSDGSDPIGGLVFDTSGNLYGTTSGGGTGSCIPFSGCGTVFKLTPSAGGKWTETTLHNFTGGADGQFPYAGLTIDSHGNLFGTTFAGGSVNGCNYFGCGVVFEMTSSGGPWTEKVIYAFTGGSDGGEPWYGTLAIDPTGKLYGTTTYTGCDGCSGYYPTVFELSPDGAGNWTQSTIYTFTDYGLPLAGVTLDGAGNLYGATESNVYGQFNFGTVFELKLSAGEWTRNIVHTFQGTDGRAPYAGVVIDSAGSLYGTTYEGGNTSCNTLGLGCGVVYKLAPQSGTWVYTALHQFNGSPNDGSQPQAGVIFDATGNLYGTTSGGGTTGSGTVFEVTP